jgi:hypothetical protein
MEMKCIFNIGKNISILAKVTQVSDVAHGPLVPITDRIMLLDILKKYIGQCLNKNEKQDFKNITLL